MMNNKIKREEPISKFINVLAHYDDDTLIDKSGKLIKIIKLDGIDFVSKDSHALNSYKNNRNNLLKNFSSEFAMYFWEVRRKSIDYPGGNFTPGLADDVNQKYKNKIKMAEMFHKELYLAIMTKPAEGLINKGFNILKHLQVSLDKDLKRQYLVDRHKELNDVTKRVLNTLSDYQPRLLSVYQKNNISFSELFEFLSQVINFDKFAVPVEIADASIALTKNRMFFSHKSGTVEIRTGDDRKKFAAVLSVKSYQPVTYPGMLDDLSLLKIEYVITQSFRFYDRQVAKQKLRDQQKDMLQSKDESITQTEQIDEAFDDTASGEVGYGRHHFTMVCYADSLDELNKHVATVISRFSDSDIVCVREDIASECGFWAQLPGNFGFILRAADISTKNMASFASLHNFASGNMSGNHWGHAVTVFETLSGSPYYFNFHYKDVGNFLIFGSMGSGKTVLIGFLILQSMKFGGRRVIFDKDRGLEILVRAMCGVYENIKPGISTGFNPCQLDDTPENRKFLSSFFKKILTSNGSSITEHENEVVEHAINGMYRLQKSERQFCHIASFFGVKKEDSLRIRFDQWHSEGAYAWIFDNPIDSLNLNSDVIGFDLTHILSGSKYKTPVLMYLTYRVEKIMEGQRGMIFFDEGWLALNDDYFKELINDWSRTPRKKNNIFGLATQVANDTANSTISKSINEASSCKIFFPNSSAERSVYVDGFGLSEHEFNLIKTLPDDQRFFLLNYGRNTNKQSVVIRANLQGLEDEIAVISGRESTLKLLDGIRQEYGDDPDVWLPIFHKRRKELINHE